MKKERGIYIPPQVRKADISITAMMLYGVLRTYDSFNIGGVWASRKTLGKKVRPYKPLSPQRITELLRDLKKADLIYFDGFKQIKNGKTIRLIKDKVANEKSLVTPKVANEKSLISNNTNIYPINSENGVYGSICLNENKKIYPTKFKLNGSALRIKRKENIHRSYYHFTDNFLEKQLNKYPSKYKQYPPSQLANQIAKGAEVIDQLVRLDKWDFCKEIKPAIEWAIKDEFWSFQIRSLARLRAKGKNGESKFTNIFDGWEMWKKNKNKKPTKKKFNEDPRNPSRKVMRKGPDGYMRGVWEN